MKQFGMPSMAEQPNTGKAPASGVGRQWPGRARVFALALGLAAGLGGPAAQAEALSSYGTEWNQIQTDWGAEQARHAERLKTIEAQPPSPDRDHRLVRENARHLEASKSLAGRRAKVQTAIVAEANRRAGAKGATSGEIRGTAGTDPTGAKGRGMLGDGDFGGAPGASNEVKGVLKDMGINAKVKTTASTVEIGDGMNMTVNKEGALGRPGTAAHQAQVQADAHNKETYVSETMKKGGFGEPDQPGRDYVAVQDHKKKAMAGMKGDPQGLASADPHTAAKTQESMQDMVKGTNKTMEHVTDNELAGIMRKNGIQGDPQGFRQRMADMKEGRTKITPEAAAQVQGASRDVFETAEAKTRAKANAEMAEARGRAAELEATGKKAEAQRVREQLVDSQAKINETARANAEKAQGYRPEGPDGAAKPAPEVAETPRAGTEPDSGPRADGPEGAAAKPEPKPAPKVTETVKPAPVEPTKPVPSETPRTGVEPEAGPRADGPEAGGGKLGKAAEVVGKGMVAVDILAGAQDAKKAIAEGDMKKLRETGLQTADGLVGAPLATGAMIKERLGANREEAGRAWEQAGANAAEAAEQGMRVDLRKGGYSREEVDRIMDARSQGDDGPLKGAYQRLGKEVPDASKDAPTLGDALVTYGEEVKQNTKEVAAGMADRGAKAGTFVKETAQDLHEIGSGLTERGVARELVNQQKANLSRDNLADGGEHIAEKLGELVGTRATPAEREGKAASDLADLYIARGADPAEARRVAEGLIAHPGDPATRQAARDLKERLKGPSAKPDAKPEADADAKSDAKPGKADGKEKVPGDAKTAAAEKPTDKGPDKTKDKTKDKDKEKDKDKDKDGLAKADPKGQTSAATTKGSDKDKAADEKDAAAKRAAEEARVKELLAATDREIAKLRGAIGQAKAGLAALKAAGVQGMGAEVAQVRAAIATMEAKLAELTALRAGAKAQPKPKPAPKFPDTPSEGGVVINKDGSRTVLTYQVDAAGRKVPVTKDYDRDGHVVRQTTVDSQGQVVPTK